MGILAFIIIFGIIVVVHEFGHFYFAKKSGILVREFAIGMGPKIFSHIGKDGTSYTIRILPLGGYVRMAGWGDDRTEIKLGSPASLTLNEAGQVTRINLSGKQLDQQALPINVTSFDLEDKLTIKGLVLDQEKTYPVHHDATVVEEDGTEVRIAPLDVQYQNASIWGRLITNFAGPMNNFILGILAFSLLFFIQGGVPNYQSNQVKVVEGGVMAKAGLKTGDRIEKIDNYTVKNWAELTEAVKKATDQAKGQPQLRVTVSSQSSRKEVLVEPKKQDGVYRIGVQPSLKTGFLDKLVGGVQTAWTTATNILNALKNLFVRPSLDQLGGPVAIYRISSRAAQSGLNDVIVLLASLSINIGIFNLIPIPALDGGKIVLNLLEVIRRKPLKRETETYVTLVGVVFMLVLMLAVTWNDIMRTFF
ncbi:RIP metalloprotease RseP [Streptococcus oricebi]|uniref:Zinc metalloprotease n=1 Tax=Streptococcus oricebi TaxID=1547447 RepID=A0ABS5B4B1_9STRE|nr:RIP metalloprotease RseP [Streptococcus oricebi]MBP2623665.1 RIP metalloprotease RseP [Streptococcus oricebi]